jgi:hypothetical protein
MMDDGTQLFFDPLPTGSRLRENMALKKEEDDGIIRPIDSIVRS